jgi:xanthine/uracil/vitamin C permease (AzgA family)
VCEVVFHVVPVQLEQAIVGIGFCIFLLGLVSGGLVVKGDGAPVALGDFTSVPVYLTLFGLAVMFVLLLAAGAPPYRWASSRPRCSPS